MAHDIFISYSSKDKAIADAVCHFLENGGIKCWMAPRDITAGFDYGDIIVNAIKNARLFVIIFSSNSADSQWVRSELNIAFSEQIPIIPFKIDESTISGSNKLILNKTHWIDAYPKYEAKLETLVDSARKILKFKCQTISEPVAEIVDKDKNKRNLKPWLYALIILAVSLSACILFFRNKTEEYSVNNITFNTRLLSERQIDAVKSILEGMREVEGGTFLMGNPQRIDEEGMRIENDKYADQRHTVTLDSFLISSTELTQKQLAAFFDTDAMIKQPGLNRPVDYLSWNQCRAIADTLAALTGVDFDLPTEAQWEYAARGGRQGAYRELLFAGSDDPLIAGWILSENAGTTTHDVALKQPNELGLYDMTGNVAEWCKDSFDLYPVFDVSNPVNESGENKVIRGGSVVSDRNHAKTYTREQWPQSFQRSYTGMRLVINKNSRK